MSIVDLFNGESVGPRTPLPVDSCEAQKLVSQSETLTYNVTKDAAGGIITASTGYHPIVNIEGDRVGSYWGNQDNLVYSTNTVDALTETAGSADVTVTDPNNNLENIFETVTAPWRFIAKVTDTSGGVLYGWISGVAASTNAYTFTIYNTRAGTTQNWVGTLSAFDLTKGAKLEIYSYQSSLAFGTGTTLTEEVAMPHEYTRKMANVIGGAMYNVQKAAQNLSNGQFFVDYYRGLIVGKKADGTNSETITYNVWAAAAITVSGTAGIYAEDSAHTSGDSGMLMLAVRNDSGAALAGTDGDYIPFTTDSNGNIRVTTGGGGSAGGGNNTYSTEQGDFTATATASTTNIVLSVDSVGGVAIDENHFANGILKVWDASSEEMIQITLDDFTWTAGTKTLAVANCTGAFTFAAGDTVSLTIVGPDKMRDYSSDAQKTVEQSPIYSRYVMDTFPHTNVANATPEYNYVNMDGYTGIEVHVEKTGGTDTFDVDYEASIEGDTSSEDWIDITGGMTFRGGSASADHIATPTLTPFSPTGFRYEITTAGGANDADFNVFIKRYY